ncbi:MAG: DUF4166 domain-containing protein [Alphaproteobacteria bacterium]
MNASPRPAPTQCLFRRIIGAAYDKLPDQIRALHDGGSYLSSTGQADVVHGPGFWAGLAILFSSLPAKGRNVPVTVEFITERNGERWRRNFNSRIFASRLSATAGGKPLLVERYGVVRVTYELVPDPHGITWRQVGMRIFGVPAPRFLRLNISARESVEHGRYVFDSNVALPSGARIVHYRGWLMADEPISQIPQLHIADPPSTTAPPATSS